MDMNPKNKINITVKQKDPEFTGTKKDEGDGYLWGLAFSPQFESVEVNFHANTNLEMKGYLFPRVDILEVTGEEPDEKLQVVISKSLIANYSTQNEQHEFILKASEPVLRLGEMVFVNQKEIPEELKKKLQAEE